MARATTTPRTVVTGRYVAGGTRASGTSVAGQIYDALHYMQTRPLDHDERPEDRHFFGPEREGGSWREARAEIMDHATEQVAFHRLILSPGPDQPVADMREWTRMVLDDLADALGQQLHWVAVIHRNTDHPHAHVLLAGGGERAGELRPVLLYKAQYAVVRASGDRSADHLRGLEREQATAVHHRIGHEERQAERASARAGAGKAGRVGAPGQVGRQGVEGHRGRESGITAPPPHGAGERPGGAAPDVQERVGGMPHRPERAARAVGEIAARVLADTLRRQAGTTDGADAVTLEEKRGRGR